jgi:hypothetical protein
MEPPVFRAYMNGELTEAIALAKSGGASEVAGVLTRFQSSYTSGQRALDRQDDATAVKQFSTALALDETIGVAKSPYRVELKRQLSSLHTLAGFRALERKDSAAAKKAFALALSIEPNNARAKVQLAKLEAASPAPPKAGSSIDDAFGDETSSAPAPTRATKPKSSSAQDDIDAAFGD